MKALEIERNSSHVLARLNRPQVRNAIDQQMVDELHELCTDLELRPQILIITGCETDKGAIFASGADIRQLRERRAADALRGINSTIFRRIAALPMPVIAAIDGFALGGGAELAFAADFRIGTPRIRIGNPETGLGIMAAAGATWRLIELVGEPVAKEILLAGRVLKADEALSLRLVTEIHEPEMLLDAAIALAERISAQDPLAVQLTKKVMHAPREAHPLVEELAQAILFESPEKFSRMDAFLDRSNRK